MNKPILRIGLFLVTILIFIAILFPLVFFIKQMALDTKDCLLYEYVINLADIKDGQSLFQIVNQSGPNLGRIHAIIFHRGENLELWLPKSKSALILSDKHTIFAAEFGKVYKLRFVDNKLYVYFRHVRSHSYFTLWPSAPNMQSKTSVVDGSFCR